MSKDRSVILTGLRANNDLHIGNYLGALLPLVDMARQKSGEYQINLFVPDLHSFTTEIDHSRLQESIMRNLRVFVAAGLPLDDENIFLYRQSYIPAHSELTWILDCFTGMGEMERMTQFKDKSAQAGEDRVGVGLFNYPVLMAADILLYGAQYVPVGEDQTQHLEFTRDIAERMNKRFGELFTVPRPVAEQHKFFGKDQGLRIRDLQNPAKKMSKSSESDKGVIFLTDSPEAARKKIMSAETDSLGEVQYGYAERPGVSNLLDMLKLFGGNPDGFLGQKQYGPLKEAVADKVGDFLKDCQSKLSAVDDKLIESKLRSDEYSMNEAANATLSRVQRAVGLRLRKNAQDRSIGAAKPKLINFGHFANMDIRVGTVVEAEKLEGSDKLLKLQVDLGKERRQILTGMQEFYEPEDFLNKQVPILVNLAPRTMRGERSEGMLLALEGDSGPVFLLPEKPLPNGSPLE